MLGHKKVRSDRITGSLTVFKLSGNVVCDKITGQHINVRVGHITQSRKIKLLFNIQYSRTAWISRY